MVAVEERTKTLKLVNKSVFIQKLADGISMTLFRLERLRVTLECAIVCGCHNSNCQQLFIVSNCLSGAASSCNHNYRNRLYAHTDIVDDKLRIEHMAKR